MRTMTVKKGGNDIGKYITRKITGMPSDNKIIKDLLGEYTPENPADSWSPHLEKAISKGFNVNKQDLGTRQYMVDGQPTTPLIWSVVGNNQEDMYLLVDNSADVNIKDNIGRTPLMVAINKRLPEFHIIEALVKEGADVNEVNDHYASTPLISAIKSGNENVVKLLLNNGANKDIMDASGKTATDYARESQNLEIDYLVSPRDIPIMTEEQFKECETDADGTAPKCGISLDELKRTDTVKPPGKNNVCYHRSHLQRWLRQSKTNPMTKEPISDDWIRENYPRGLKYNYNETRGGKKRKTKKAYKTKPKQLKTTQRQTKRKKNRK